MATDFKFPDLGEGVTEGEIKKWLVKVGDKVVVDQSLAEVETDKAVVEMPSPVAGTVLRLDHKEGEVVKVGETLATIGEVGEVAPINTAGPEPSGRRESVSVVGELPTEEIMVSSQQVTAAATGMEVQAVPAVRKVAKELGVDISKVVGTGPGGRITEEDVRGAAGKTMPVPTEPPKKKMATKFDLYGWVDRVPLKGIRRSTAKHMMESQAKVAAVTAMDQADVTDLVAIRDRLKDEVQREKGIKITYMPFIIKAVVQSLKLHPYINCVIDDEQEQIVLKKYYNIGVAVAIDEGLVVPVIKAADQKGIVDLADEIRKMTDMAKERKLDLADLKGGTFTITNYGVFGAIYGTPIINYPEVAILGVGKIMDTPLVIDGEIKVRKVLPLSLTFDHRAFDGAEAGRFMSDMKRYLENPELLLLEASNG